MKDQEEKKAEELLDGKTEEQEEKTEEKPQKELTPGQALREMTSGKLILMQPFRAHSEDISELRYDFCALTTEEEMDALDSVPMNNMFAISNKQALALFAATAAKCAPELEEGVKKTRMYDATDIRKRLGPADAIKAIQLAKAFYAASSQAGSKNISK